MNNLCNNSVHDEVTRAVKVIILWAGSEGGRATGVENELSLLKYRLKILKEVDQGVNMDVIFINHMNEKLEGDENYEKYKAYLNNLNNQKTKNGRIIVLHRKNIGYSFAGFNYAWQLYRDHYDYFWFAEDDYINVSSGAMAQGVSFLEKDEEPYVCTNFHRGRYSEVSFCTGSNLITKSGNLKLALKTDYSDIIKHFARVYRKTKPIAGRARRNFHVFPPEDQDYQDFPFEKNLDLQSSHRNHWLAELQLPPLIKYFYNLNRKSKKYGTCLRPPCNEMVWWGKESLATEAEYKNNNDDAKGFQGTKRIPWDKSMLLD